MIYINPRFPKTKKAYVKSANENVDRLKAVMSKLSIHTIDQHESTLIKPKPHSDGYISFIEKKKPKTFKL